MAVGLHSSPGTWNTTVLCEGSLKCFNDCGAIMYIEQLLRQAVEPLLSLGMISAKIFAIDQQPVRWLVASRVVVNAHAYLGKTVKLEHESFDRDQAPYTG